MKVKHRDGIYYYNKRNIKYFTKSENLAIMFVMSGSTHINWKKFKTKTGRDLYFIWLRINI